MRKLLLIIGAALVAAGCQPGSTMDEMNSPDAMRTPPATTASPGATTERPRTTTGDTIGPGDSTVDSAP